MKYGFDLTAIPAKDFEEMLSEYQLELCARVDGEPFTWKRDGLVVVTGNNPITGEYRNSAGRRSEKGYASYIGIEGEAGSVQRVVDFIRARAEYVKDESPGERDFI